MKHTQSVKNAILWTALSLAMACGGGSNGGSGGFTGDASTTITSDAFLVDTYRFGADVKDLPSTTKIAPDMVEVRCGPTSYTEDGATSLTCLSKGGDPDARIYYRCNPDDIAFIYIDDEEVLEDSTGDACLRLKCVDGGADIIAIGCTSGTKSLTDESGPDEASEDSSDDTGDTTTEQ